LARRQTTRSGAGLDHADSLDEAREAALNCRKLRAKGGDPIAHRRTTQAAQRVALAKRTLFGECVDSYVAAHQAEWNETYTKRWRATLDRYAISTLGALPVDAVDKRLVLTRISHTGVVFGRRSPRRSVSGRRGERL
jgi:hypothetical protein